MAGALGTKPPTGVTAPKQTSAPQGTATGTDAKMGAVKFPIQTSAPTDPHTLGRAPQGWLK